jgi:putative two-component system response regulator
LEITAMDLNNRILAVDDHSDNLWILEELLGGSYSLKCVRSGEEALRVAPLFRPNLVLLDVMMPGLNGRQTCRMLRAKSELRDTKIVMLSARTALNDRLAAYEAGAVDYIGKPFDHQEVLAKVRAWMQMVCREEVDKIWQEADKTREVMGSALVTLAAFRDTETGEHLFRMRWYSQALAEQLAMAGPYCPQIDELFLQQLYRASPLHDIGKVGIDDAILRKPGPLTAEEFEVIKQHAVIGGDILAHAAIGLPHADYMKMATTIARYHHERFDGNGYPEGLRGMDIPLAARIVSVADVFDALTSRRVYKDAIPAIEAATIIEEQSGRQFDPAVVDAFVARFQEFQQVQQRFADGLSIMNPTDFIAESASNDCGNCYQDQIGADHTEHILTPEGGVAPEDIKHPVK